jgi:hypothetical protein
MRRLAIAATLLLAASAARAVDLHVDGASGVDTRDGLTWAASFRTVARGVTVAKSLPGPDVIHVAAGTYRENLLIDESDISLLGGYPPGGAGARDPAVHATILDGGATAPVIVVSGVDGTVVLQAIVIDGLTLTNGRSFQRGGFFFGGAGVFVEEAQVQITNNVIRANTADGAGAKGGGVYVFRTSARGAVVRGNRIEDNVVPDGVGGGVSLVDQGDPVTLGALVLDANTILRNRVVAATDIDPSVTYEPNGVGGGVFAWGGRTVVQGNTFQANVAEATTSTEPGVAQGGGLFLLDGAPVVTNNVIEANTAIAGAGRFGGNGGGAYVLSAGGTFDTNTVLSNVARGAAGDNQGLGGGLNFTLVDTAAPTLTNNTIRDNAVTGSTLGAAAFGGGLYVFVRPGSNSRVTVSGGVVEQNRAPQAGGGIYAYSSSVNAVQMDATLVRANEADYASGIMALGEMELTNLRIRENRVFDPDNDTVSEIRDTCPGISNPVQNDTDGDTLGDACDLDDDDDGVPDSNDNCRVVDNPNQADSNGNGLGNACDGDQDADGWADAIDNCPQAANPTQDDATNDGVGDACEPAAFDPLETNASGIWLAGDSILSNAEITDNVGQGILVVGVPASPGVALDHASPVITNATIGNNLAVGFITYLATGTTWRDTIIASNAWSDGFDTEDMAGNPSSPGMICDHVNFGDGVASLPCTGPGNFSATPRWVAGPLGSYYLSQTSAGQATTSTSVDAGSRSVTGSVVETLSTRTDMVDDAGTVDLGFHYGAGPPPVVPGDPLDDEVRVGRTASGVAISIAVVPPGLTSVRIFRGDLNLLVTEYSHSTPFSGQPADPECSWAAATPFVDTAGLTDGQDWYYLVVPLAGTTEGDFGADSFGVARPRPEDLPGDRVVSSCP